MAICVYCKRKRLSFNFYTTHLDFLCKYTEHTLCLFSAYKNFLVYCLDLVSSGSFPLLLNSIQDFGQEAKKGGGGGGGEEEEEEKEETYLDRS